MPKASRRAIYIAVVLVLACRRDDSPLERLPAPRGLVLDPAMAPRPPPPPPPPKGGSPIGPPSRVTAFLAAHAHREAPCRASIKLGATRVELGPERAEQLVTRLGRYDSWTDGMNGCVSEGFDVEVACGGGEPLQLWTSCGNVKVGGEDCAWSDAMDAWFAELRSKLP